MPFYKTLRAHFRGLVNPFYCQVWRWCPWTPGGCPTPWAPTTRSWGWPPLVSTSTNQSTTSTCSRYTTHYASFLCHVSTLHTIFSCYPHTSYKLYLHNIYTTSIQYLHNIYTISTHYVNRSCGCGLTGRPSTPLWAQASTWPPTGTVVYCTVPYCTVLYCAHLVV